MKGNFKFLTIVVAVLLASTLLLTGCMYAIAASNGEAKQYDLDAMSDSAGENVNVGINPNGPPIDAPIAQTDLKKKFSAMTKIDDENKTITLITDEYLNQYWCSSDSPEYRALTTEEVLYIIQDTINVFYNGDYIKIILPDFGPDSSWKWEVKEFSGPVRNQQQNMETVYQIIVQRIKMLSSAEAFIYVNDNTYYVPGETDAQTREFIADALDPTLNSIIDREILSDYFMLFDSGVGWKGTIIFYDKESPKQVYPTNELATQYMPTLKTEYGDEGCYVHLNLVTGGFAMGQSAYTSFAIIGTFERSGDDLLLYAYGSTEVVYVLHREDDHFVSESKETGMGLKEGLIFHADNDAFWNILLNWTAPEKEPNKGGTVTTQPDDTLPMESGVYEFPKDMREKIYDVLLLPENEWTDAVPDCVWHWEWKAESYDGEIFMLGLCDCKTLTDFTNQRSRKLTDDELEWIADVFLEYKPTTAR